MNKKNLIPLALAAAVFAVLAFLTPKFLPPFLSEKATYFLLSITGAIVTYGMLGATGKYVSGGIRLGGSAAVLVGVFIVLALTTPAKSPHASQKLEVILKLPVGVRCEGTVFLRGVNVAIDRLALNEGGFFAFVDIPFDYRHVEVEIKLTGYKAVKKTLVPGVRRTISLAEGDLEKEPVAEISPRFGEPVVSAQRKTTTGLAERPKLQFPFFVKDKRPPAEGVDLHVTRMRDGESLYSKKEDIQIANPGSSRWSIDIDTGRIIPENSFGKYRGELMAWNGPHTTLEWNYLYSASFEDITRTFELLDNTQKVKSRDKVAMVIVNDSNKKGFLTVRAKMEFDFKYDFCIRGRYRIGRRQGKEMDNPALDIGIGNQSGDIVSFILGAEGGRAFLIKKSGEDEISASLGEGGNKSVFSSEIIDVSRDQYVYIAITMVSAGSSLIRSSIYCKDAEIVDFEAESPRITRMLPKGILGSQKTRVSLRLWQAGWVDIDGLEVADITPTPVARR